MKIYFTLLLMIFFGCAYGQDSGNRFQQAEQSQLQPNDAVAAESGQMIGGDEPIGGPGGPGEPLPINSQIPLLAIAGIGIIIYSAYRKKSIS